MDDDILTVQREQGETPKHYPKRDTAKAHLLLNAADHKRKYAEEAKRHDRIGTMMDRHDAESMERLASSTLAIPADFVEQGTGGELTVPQEDGADRPGLVELVKEPDWVNVYASRERIELLDKAKVFNLGADTAESIKPKDATEKMLAHQMAAAHKYALDLLADSARQRDPVERARLANTAARLMDTYQRGMLTLNRVRSGGQQVVTVQHVQVSDGGQAVITGPVNTGGATGGGQ